MVLDDAANPRGKARAVRRDILFKFRSSTKMRAPQWNGARDEAIGVPPLPLRQPGAERRLAEGAAFRLGSRARAALARAPAILSSAGTRLRQGRHRAVFDDFGRGPHNARPAA